MELSDLPAHSHLIERLRRAVVDHDHWRWLELSCSLAAGRGDELSDIDVGVGHTVTADRLPALGLALVEAVGPVVDVLVHAEPSWPDGIVRFAVEYEIGVQLDLVVMPTGQRPGLPQGSVALVDKDDQLSTVWTPPVAAATADEAREWTMLGWWALSDTAKYVRRRSLFEAVEALREARTQALRLFAAGRGIPYPAFGLTTLLDVEPSVVPDRLQATYSTPRHAQDILAAAEVVADLLEAEAERTGDRLGLDLSTPWAAIARERLRAAGEQPLDGGIANAGRVVRRGPHVLRPATPHTGSVHALLRSLRAAGFDGAPEPIGVEADGRERLTFVEGEVPVAPYPDWSRSDATLASVARLLRRFHDAAAHFDPDGHPWNDALADPRGGTVVCHNDIELANVVFRHGDAVALIDFEFAAPGRPIYDLAHLARLCVPVEHEIDRERMGWEPSDHPARLRLLADAYGLDDEGRSELLEAIDDALERVEATARHGFGQGGARAAEIAARTGGMEKYDRRRRWWALHRHRFAAVLG